MTDHRNTEHFFGAGTGNHLDYADCVADRACARYERHRNGIAPAIIWGSVKIVRGITRWLTRRGSPSVNALCAAMPPALISSFLVLLMIGAFL
jgi:hypothetical protein